MFDSFEGLPPADERDGPLAATYQADTKAPEYFDNCRASVQAGQDAASHFTFAPDEAVIVPGWFSDTIPVKRAALAPSGRAVLRVYCDWYERVKLVLQECAPMVLDEGVIILDDYFAWDGCARATHDCLSQNDLAYRIKSLPSFHCAWMEKRPARVG
jgi:hypothetical protein